ncbi:MAG: SMC-Scp complex subunit ScpB [Epsilonproteobacteria bacterium]|nr:MAG: SMC-Scp complex subunit ScpB [Campylobacterota bacterium]RLA65344.1 MAG: SMC-Scp complex subunit ScpB [Campylobacterota bacterium]
MDNKELNEKIAEENKAASEGLHLTLDYLDDSKQEDSLWKARTGLDAETLCGAIETIIFMSDKPVSLLRLRSVIDADMPLRVIHESLAKLIKRYEEKLHGIRLVEVAEGYQFRTKATYAKYIQDLFKVHALHLTPAALEVLAVIAYKQPVSRVEIDQLRGVDSSHLVRALMDKRLVRVMGRSEELGRPVLYGTSKEFLEVFNLADISELPPEGELEELANKNEVGEISDIKELVTEGSESFFYDEIEELDELASKIKSIASETAFTKNLKDEEKKKLAKEEGKSAFDILEEHLIKDQIVAANREAVLSELINEFEVEASILKELTGGPYNPPLGDDVFEMVDLETGEPLDDLLEKENNLQEITQNTLDKASELGLNLDFLDDEPSS